MMIEFYRGSQDNIHSYVLKKGKKHALGGVVTIY